MHLDHVGRVRYYKLWKGLLAYTNQVDQVVPGLKSIRTSRSIPVEQILPVRDHLWKNPEIITRYIKANPDQLNEKDLNTCEAWKNRVTGRFIMVKHLKQYTVFMNEEENNALYGVIGITDPIKNAFHETHLPLFLETVLLPYEGKIIYDSILQPYTFTISSTTKKNIVTKYGEQKKALGIITRL